nr:MAG TPA: hypothetical protein [Caudoviricetes sp.]DAS97263.1 MAG TPA: hypothetical protein [Caudoviricetes sp.]DAT99691.1 MAG TPA: hypothetical protein [Caudoviricetes sp.]
MAGSRPRGLACSQWARRMETSDRWPVAVSSKREERAP